MSDDKMPESLSKCVNCKQVAGAIVCGWCFTCIDRLIHEATNSRTVSPAVPHPLSEVSGLLENHPLRDEYVAALAASGAQTCVHCDPSFVPTGPDGWCDCSCHKPAATTSAATPSGLGSMRRERYIWDSAISTAVAEVERLRDEKQSLADKVPLRGGGSSPLLERIAALNEVAAALRALQPSTPSEEKEID